MVLNINDLKVDQTAIPVDDDFILISNFNIPDRFLGNLLEDDIPRRIRNLILEDYRGVGNVQYQVTATYQLSHEVSGATRQWSGSFMPGGNQHNALSDFQRFGPDFEAEIIRLSDRRTATERLRFHNVDTHWKLDSITSIIVNVQASVRSTHPTLARRNIRYRHGHRHYRNHVAFPLP